MVNGSTPGSHSLDAFIRGGEESKGDSSCGPAVYVGRDIAYSAVTAYRRLLVGRRLVIDHMMVIYPLEQLEPAQIAVRNVEGINLRTSFFVQVP